MTDIQKTAYGVDFLYPEQTLSIEGERITVREFTFIEGLRAGHIASSLLADLAALFESGGARPSRMALAVIFARHEETFLYLLSMVTGKDTDWLRELSDGDEQRLFTAFWMVNQAFFSHRLIEMGRGYRQALSNLEKPLATVR